MSTSYNFLHKDTVVNFLMIKFKIIYFGIKNIINGNRRLFKHLFLS